MVFKEQQKIFFCSLMSQGHKMVLSLEKEVKSPHRFVAVGGGLKPPTPLLANMEKASKGC
jgi:hypothetical protein